MVFSRVVNKLLANYLGVTNIGRLYLAKSVPFLIVWKNPQAGKMKQILLSDWLPEQARWRSGSPAFVPQEKNSPF